MNTVNRQCSSGLASITQIANEITTGQIDMGIAAGVESMTMGYGAGAMPEKMSDKVTAVPEAADCLLREQDWRIFVGLYHWSDQFGFPFDYDP